MAKFSVIYLFFLTKRGSNSQNQLDKLTFSPIKLFVNNKNYLICLINSVLVYQNFYKHLITSDQRFNIKTKLLIKMFFIMLKLYSLLQI